MHISDAIRKYAGWCPGLRAVQGRKKAAPCIGTATDNPAKTTGTSLGGTAVPGAPMRRLYEHTQVGMLQIVAILGVMVIIITTTLLAGAFLIPLAVLGLLVFAVLCFATLTVSVCDDAVRIRFGPIGLFTREFPVADIASAAAVRNPWYYGYGIRWTPDGPLYNVAGKDAVEIRQYSGKTVRIGTDEPDVLLREIELARTGRNVHGHAPRR